MADAAAVVAVAKRDAPALGVRGGEAGWGRGLTGEAPSPHVHPGYQACTSYSSERVKPVSTRLPRLVALAMDLGMAEEKLDADGSQSRRCIGNEHPLATGMS